MEIDHIAALGYATAMLAFGALSALMLGRWRDRPRATLIALAAGSTALWAAVQTLGSLGSLTDPFVHFIVEWLRGLAWIATVIALLQDIDASVFTRKGALRYGGVFLVGCALLIGYYVLRTNDSLVLIGSVTSGVLLSALMLLLVEQLYRNAPFDTRVRAEVFLRRPDRAVHLRPDHLHARDRQPAT